MVISDDTDGFFSEPAAIVLAKTVWLFCQWSQEVCCPPYLAILHGKRILSLEEDSQQELTRNHQKSRSVFKSIDQRSNPKILSVLRCGKFLGTLKARRQLFLTLKLETKFPRKKIQTNCLFLSETEKTALLTVFDVDAVPAVGGAGGGVEVDKDLRVGGRRVNALSRGPCPLAGVLPLYSSARLKHVTQLHAVEQVQLHSLQCLCRGKAERGPSCGTNW